MAKNKYIYRKPYKQGSAMYRGLDNYVGKVLEMRNKKDYCIPLYKSERDMITGMTIKDHHIGEKDTKICGITIGIMDEDEHEV